MLTGPISRSLVDSRYARVVDQAVDEPLKAAARRDPCHGGLWPCGRRVSCGSR